MLACLALAACGEADDAPRGGAFADLRIAVDRDGPGGRPARTVTIRCETPERSPACRAAADVDPKAFEPTPGNVACTEQYGGPQTATVTGTLRGERVDSRFSREDGCEIARWRDAQALLEAAR